MKRATPAGSADPRTKPASACVSSPKATTVAAYYTARAEHSGWPGILHGGIALTLMDEAFGWSLYFHGSAGLTGRFEARLRQQIPVGANLVIRAWTTEKRKKFAKARAEIRQNSECGQLVAEADAMMFLITRI